MRRRLLFLLGIIPALLLETPGGAQERPNGFYLTSPLGLSSGYDDNFVAGSRALDGSVSLLTTPTFAWMKSTHRSIFSLATRGNLGWSPRTETRDAGNNERIRIS